MTKILPFAFFILMIFVANFIKTNDSSIRAPSSNTFVDCEKVFEEIVLSGSYKWYERAVQAVKIYLKEVKETKGLRLALKEYNEIKYERRLIAFKEYLKEEEKKDIFLTRWGNNIFQFVPRKITRLFFGKEFDIRPFSNLYYYIVEKNIAKITEKYTGNRKELTNLIALPTALVGGYFIWEKVDETYFNQFDKKIDRELLEHKDEWLYLIRNHYAFRYINRELLSGKQDDLKILRKAYSLKLQIEYLFSMSSEEDEDRSKEDLIMAYATNPMLEHLANVYFNGVPIIEKSYIYKSAFNERITDEQFLELVNVEISKLSAQQVIWETFINDNLDFKDDLLEMIGKDSFENYLYTSFQEGKITREKFTSLLQEDIYWKSEFLRMDVINVQQKFRGENGYENRPLYLDDIRAEIIQEIEQY